MDHSVELRRLHTYRFRGDSVSTVSLCRKLIRASVNYSIPTAGNDIFPLTLTTLNGRVTEMWESAFINPEQTYTYPKVHYHYYSTWKHFQHSTLASPSPSMPIKEFHVSVQRQRPSTVFRFHGPESISHGTAVLPSEKASETRVFIRPWWWSNWNLPRMDQEATSQKARCEIRGSWDRAAKSRLLFLN